MVTIFDIIIFSIIVVSTIMSAYKGLFGMAINLLGFVGFVFTGIFLFSYITLALAEYIENALILSVLSAVLSYLCSSFILTSIISRINSSLSGIKFGFFDPFLGTIAGFLRGILISIIVFMSITIFSSTAYLRAENFEKLLSNIDVEKYPAWLADSKTPSSLEILSNKLISSFPEGFLRSIKLPGGDKDEEEDIIDAIKNRKGQGVTSSITAPIAEDINLKK